MPRVYLCGPIQHVHSRGKGWRERVKSRYTDIEWVDPISKYDDADEAAEWEDERIVAEDKALIDGCDAVLLHYEKVPSWGTPREQEYAAANGELSDFIDALEHAGVPEHTIETALHAIGRETFPSDIPVFVQTTEADPSPWLTCDAETVQRTFDDVVWHIKAYFGVKRQLDEADA